MSKRGSGQALRGAVLRGRRDDQGGRVAAADRRLGRLRRRERRLQHAAEGRAKPRYIRQNPIVGVHVMDPADPFKWVSVSGHAEMTAEGADEHIDKMAKKYMGVDTYPYRAEGEERLIVRVRPERIASSGFDGG